MIPAEPDRQPWLARRACRPDDLDLFFATRSRKVRRAKAICADCPVRQDCLDHAIADPSTRGVWGGLTEPERRHERRRRRRSLL